MSGFNSSDRSRMIMIVLSLIAVFSAIDMALVFTQTDFWQQPAQLTTKFGAAGYELTVLSILTIVLAVPAYLLQRWGYGKCARFALMLAIVPVFLVLIAGWSFFGLFEKFIGSYAIQMLLQDGGQLVEFVGKMPSAVDHGLLFGGLGLLLCLIALIVSNHRPVRIVRSGLSGIALVALVLSVVASGIWNHPEPGPEIKDQNNAVVVARVKESEFLMLKSRSGPFSELFSSLAEKLTDTAPEMKIDVTKLRHRGIQSETLEDTPQRKPYNVVFILVESLRPDMLSAFSDEDRVMPTVDALSENAIVLSNAWAQASHSNYADVSALSGQYPLRSMDIHFYPERPEYPKSLPYAALAKYGYQVGLFSSQNEKWGLMENYLKDDSVDLFSHVGSSSHDETNAYTGIKITENESGATAFEYGDFMYQASGNSIERLDGETTGIALDWLSEKDSAEPVFMYFNYQASHSPFNALPPGYERKFLVENDEMAEKVKQGLTMGVRLNYVVNSYRDGLNYIDQNIKAVVDAMKASGRHENTIYVVSADTSIRFSARLIGNGGALWPDVMKVPVIIAGPGMQGRKYISEPTAQIDIVPTVFGLLGLRPPEASQGVDLTGEMPVDRPVFSVAQTPAAHQYSIVDGDWQLVHDFNTMDYTLSFVGGKGRDKVEPSPARLVSMSEKLRNWKNSQIAYYSQSGVSAEYNPPRYWAPEWNGTTLLTEGASDAGE